MVVKIKQNQLSFMFQDSDPFFEMGYMIIDQSNMAQMLPYKRSEQSGKEKLVFQTEGYIPLKEAIKSLSTDEVVNLIYAMIFMVEKVEENGFLKKECIWFDYDCIYYDEKLKKPMFAVLPVNKEVERPDGKRWAERFADAISQASTYLMASESVKVKSITNMWTTGDINYNDMLNKVNNLGSGKSFFFVDRAKEEKTMLTLLYSGHEGRITFEIYDEDFILGKNPNQVDGVIDFSRAVSRKHCKIIKQGQKYFVQDIGSTNHTFVNGEFIPHFELAQLEDNDTLSVADVDFRVHINPIRKQ